ncbi:lipoprotein NlpI [Stieleria maiorica]|uniref:Lipoprotein NlpI n=1 Tax=Stieleria maiorica TaxID=2795974 RepID=A0A5B9MNZ4_9BACT|nr:tetratricopeptide repeat-containing sulfotransferase family protein [Stieleria maiorica]QEG01647.1 lipoprotein NlpI [Stieleria maiorica]
MEQFDVSIQQGLAFHQAGKSDQAKQIYVRLIEQNKDKVDALHLLGLLMHEEEKHDEAYDLVATAVNLMPSSAILHNSLGVVELARKRWECAANHFRDSIAIQPSPEAHRNLGISLYRMGDVAEAESSIANAALLSPMPPSPYLDLGRLAMENQDWKLAERCLRRLFDPNGNIKTDSRIMIDLARVLNAQSRTDESVAILLPLLKQSPPNSDLHTQLGIAFGLSGDHEKAVQHLSAASQLAPNCVASWMNLSISLSHLQRWDDALTCARTAASIDEDPKALLHLCRLLHQRNFVDEEYQILRRHLRNADNPIPELIQRLAEIEAERGNHDDAIALLCDLINNDPANHRALLRLAEISEHANRIDATVRACVSLLQRDPDSVPAHLLLGLVLSSRLTPQHRAKLDLKERDGLVDRALKHFSRAANLDPSAETYDAWGVGLIRSGEHEKAIEKLQHAIHLAPTFAPSHLNLGKAKLETGDLTSAKAHFRQTIKLQEWCGDAHYELACLGDDDDSFQSLRQLLALLESKQPNQRQRMMLHFAAAKKFESERKSDQAFEHYRKANAIKSRHDQSGSVRDFVASDAIIDVFSERYFHDHPIGSESDVPIFIVGMPRSGTTLIEQVLASHPCVHGAGELNDISDLANSLTRKSRTGLPFPYSAKEIDKPLANELASQYLTRLHRVANSAGGNSRYRHITDKMPTNFRHLGLIATLFPNARVIHCTRDPRDVCVSCYKQNLAWPFCDLIAVADYFTQYHRMMAHWKKVLPINILDVNYEKFVTDQPSQTKRVLAYCGLPWDRQCLEFTHTKRVVSTPSKLQVRQPLYQSSVGAWKKYEDHLQPLLKRLATVLQSV